MSQPEIIIRCVTSDGQEDILLVEEIVINDARDVGQAGLDEFDITFRSGGAAKGVIFMNVEKGRELFSWLGVWLHTHRPEP